MALHASSTRGLASILRRAARGKAAQATAGIVLGAGAAHAATHTVAETIEHTGHAFLHNGGADRAGEALRGGLGAASAFGMRGAVRSSAVAAGFAGGVLKGVGRPAAKAAHLGVESGAAFAKKAFVFDEEHGVHISNWAGNRISLAVAAGAAAMSVGAVQQAQEQNLQRQDDGTGREEPERPEAHRQSLGAHGSMVTQGARMARKRY